MNFDFMLMLAMLRKEHLANSYQLIRTSSRFFDILDVREIIDPMICLEMVSVKDIIKGVRYFTVTGSGELYFNNNLKEFKSEVLKKYDTDHFIYLLI